MGSSAISSATANGAQKNTPSGYARKTVALIGNPNVGKSTVFNALTGMNQHTGNWPGKTVASARGRHTHEGVEYTLVDLPGIYSLNARSPEEEVARDFLLHGGADAVVVVCDATCLERNLILALQTLALAPRAVICVNLMDEAQKKGIHVDLEKLGSMLNAPAVGTSARAGKGLYELMQSVCAITQESDVPSPCCGEHVQGERAITKNSDVPSPCCGEHVQGERTIIEETGAASTRCAGCPHANCAHAEEAAADIVRMAERICMAAAPRAQCASSYARDRKLDGMLTGRRMGIPVMLLMLCAVFTITLAGANVPSKLLADGLFYVQDRLTALFFALNAPDWLHGALVLGVYRVLAWVVSVMLPPMAIFFPLFTLLEDFGYLPRVAFNLDHQFCKARACGKQALTMTMGFGCNAVGVTGCRIIDSPRERLIAILTNSLVPCNGRFPTLIALISMFFVGTAAGMLQTALSAFMLSGVIVLGICATFLLSRFLSATILKGEPSSFTLELPPYRTPQIGKVLVRSLLDRTVFVLGRAAAVAAPAGLLLWLLANIHTGGMSLLAHCAGFLDPFAHSLGLDGVILIAFILGSPANEIVFPIIIMGYLSTGTLQDMGSLTDLQALLTAHGWTWATAASAILMCLFHWPCATTCLTIKKETGSMKWTALSIALPTALGMAACFTFTFIVRLLGVA